MTRPLRELIEICIDYTLYMNEAGLTKEEDNKLRLKLKRMRKNDR